MRMTCKECGEEFDLKPDKKGLANVCPACTENREDTARKAADAESLRRSLRKAIRLNQKKREKTLKEDQELNALGYERVPGKKIHS